MKSVRLVVAVVFTILFLTCEIQDDSGGADGNGFMMTTTSLIVHSEARPEENQHLLHQLQSDQKRHTI